MMITYGSTTNFVVSYDSSFTGGTQPNGPALGQGVIDYCEYDLVRLSMLFGGILPPASSLPFQINLVPGSGGASNNLLNTIDCFCDLNTDPLGLPALVVAEEAEIFMNLQGRGWIPNWSNGEALSRVSAQFYIPIVHGCSPRATGGSMATQARRMRRDRTGWTTSTTPTRTSSPSVVGRSS